MAEDPPPPWRPRPPRPSQRRVRPQPPWRHRPPQPQRRFRPQPPWRPRPSQPQPQWRPRPQPPNQPPPNQQPPQPVVQPPNQQPPRPALNQQQPLVLPEPHITFTLSNPQYTYLNFAADVINQIQRTANTHYIERFDPVRNNLEQYIRIALITMNQSQLTCLMRRSDMYICGMAAGDQVFHKFSDVHGFARNEYWEMGLSTQYPTTSEQEGGAFQERDLYSIDWGRMENNVEFIVAGLVNQDMEAQTTEMTLSIFQVVIMVSEGVRFHNMKRAFNRSRILSLAGKYSCSLMFHKNVKKLIHKWKKATKSAMTVEESDGVPNDSYGKRTRRNCNRRSQKWKSVLVHSISTLESLRQSFAI